MTNLTSNKPRRYHGEPGRKVAIGVGANLRIFTGGAYMFAAATGLLADVTPTASGKFAGFAAEEKDNRTGSPFGGTAGSCAAEVEQSGAVYLTVAHTGTYARTDVGATVYASDNDTFTLDAGTNNIVIGKVAMVPDAVVGAATGEILVEFEASPVRSI